MKYFADMTEDGIINGVSTVSSDGTSNITEKQYHEILAAIEEKPPAGDGYDYRLRTDMTWEMYELPEDEQNHGYTEADLAAMTNAELETILSGFGISANMNKANMIRLILAVQGGDAYELV